jgi:hypothetical protein
VCINGPLVYWLSYVIVIWVEILRLSRYRSYAVILMWNYLQNIFSILGSTFFWSTSVWSPWINFFKGISGILVYRILQFCLYKCNQFAFFYFGFCGVSTLHSLWSCPLPKAYMQLLVSCRNVLLLYQDHTIPKKFFYQLSSEFYILHFLNFKVM